jgi:rod shape-determining protein MreD
MKLKLLLIVLGVAIIFQVSVVPFIAMGTFKPDLPILVILFLAARRGPFEGVLAGFISGLLLDSLSSGFLGLTAFTYSLSGFVVGKLFYSDVPMSLGRWALGSGLGILAHSLIFVYIYTLGDAPPIYIVIVRQALPAALYTWIVGMFWAISPLYERRGGVRLD